MFVDDRRSRRRRWTRGGGGRDQVGRREAGADDGAPEDADVAREHVVAVETQRGEATRTIELEHDLDRLFHLLRLDSARRVR